MSGPEKLIAHLRDCRDVAAAIVVDGSADDVVAGMIAAGWTYGGVEVVEGKRVRYLTPPATGLEPQ